MTRDVEVVRRLLDANHSGELPSAALFTLTEGLVTKAHIYESRDEALEAAGT